MTTLSDNVLKGKIISQEERDRQVTDFIVEGILSQEEYESRSVKHLLPDRDIMTSRQSTRRTLPRISPFSCFVVDPEPSEDQIQGASLELIVGDELFVMKG